ncbi:cAMP-binding protein [Indibacter alkaliphilus LW1]|uniref:cAMP-binding protein n=1 Tax=Indibacter alkaliphilus (strain CCUG 57479 / KCTC 22604 / LW1) TaxID=1189612 RepID=S2E3W2_INDAL|nr:Crp/Fnr family transcriptional regulator [Indibacter alkaliphilus]EOZ99231.1 cAMP-binding protein [Indibacter alkaliphilus LW1]
MHHLLKDYFRSHTNADDKVLERISPYFIEKTFKRNEYLLREGEVCKYNYFVISGCMRLFTTNKEGVENTRYIAFEGKFGTSFTSLITGLPAFENIQSLEKNTVLQIRKDDFYTLVETEPSVNKVYRNILESAYITTQRRIYDFQGKDSLERVQWLLKNQPKILNRISNKVVASYLGITPYTLSRLKSKL